MFCYDMQWRNYYEGVLYTQLRMLGSQCGREALLERINLKSRYNRYAKLSNARQMIDQLGSE